MRNFSLRDILQYKFDEFMSKGAMSLVGFLFIASTIVVFVTGILGCIFGSVNSIAHGIWISVMHIIDAGTITGASTSNKIYLILMCLVTLCGIFVTSILIGIITSGFEEKLNSLRRGNSKVIEKGHTVILGFNESIYTIISELLEANLSRKRICIVILGRAEKEVMESLILQNVSNLHSAKIICRSGRISDLAMLQRCSVENCKSIIINTFDDHRTVKAILAINTLLQVSTAKSKPHVVASVAGSQNTTVANLAGKFSVEQSKEQSIAEILDAHDIVSRIIAKTICQPGLEKLLSELFSFIGNEFYFENFPGLSGLSFSDAALRFEQATLVGFKRDGEIYLNPSSSVIDTTLREDDQIILISEDDGVAKPKSSAPELQKIQEINRADNSSLKKAQIILILGENKILMNILELLNRWFDRRTKVIVADSDIDLEFYENSKFEPYNINIEFKKCDTNDRAVLERLVTGEIDDILLLNSDKLDADVSDAMNLMKLINIQNIINERLKKPINITSEMRLIASKKLANVTCVNDLVIGVDILNKIKTQISEIRDLNAVFNELLRAKGAEFYIRKVTDYMEPNQRTNFYYVCDLVARRGEIFIGFKKGSDVIINPTKSLPICFGEKDFLIVMAQEA